jgi:hypothetical protein
MAKDKTEYKKYDTRDKVVFAGARLAKDAESRDGEHGKMVRLTTVSTSRKDAHDDLWLEVNVGDFHAELASFLKKGDILHLIEGKLCLRRYGDDKEKFSIVIDRAEIAVPLELQAECKERGWVPGEKSKADGKKADKKGDKKSTKTEKTTAKKPAPIEIEDDPEEDEPEEDEDE